MAFWRPIQTATAGLLSLLGIKNVGRNPDLLSDTVVPAIEMEGWWLRGASENLRVSSIEAPTGATVIQVLAVVPANEWWHVDHLSVEIICAAATAGQNVAIQLCAPVTGAGYFKTPYNVAFAQLGAGFRMHAQINNVWVQPGSTIQVVSNAALLDNLVIGDMIGTRVQV